jgi:hypothetical protein
MHINNQTCNNTMPRDPTTHLFLGSSLRIGLILSSLVTRTLVSSLAPGITELSVSTTLNWSWHLALLDLGDGNCWGNGESSAGALDVVTLKSGSDILLGSIGLGGLASLSWEKDKAGLVSLQALDVGGKGLDGQVLAAWVDGNTDGWRKLAWDTGLLIK